MVISHWCRSANIEGGEALTTPMQRFFLGPLMQGQGQLPLIEDFYVVEIGGGVKSGRSRFPKNESRPRSYPKPPSTREVGATCSSAKKIEAALDPGKVAQPRFRVPRSAQFPDPHLSAT